MPNHTEQSKLDRELVVATCTYFADKKGSIEKAKALLEAGANPTAPVLDIKGLAGNAISEALKIDAYPILDMIFTRYSGGKHGVINLSEQAKVPGVANNANLLQAAMILCSPETQELAINYALSIDKSPNKEQTRILIDKRIVFPRIEGLKGLLPHLIFNLISPTTCLQEKNIHLELYTESEINTVAKFLRAWRLYSEKLNPGKGAPKFDGPIHIYMDGNLDTIKLLLNHDFINFDTIAYDRVTVGEYIDNLVDTSDLESWVHSASPFIALVSPIEKSTNLEFFGLPYECFSLDPEDNNIVLIKITATNIFKQLPQDFIIHFDARPLRDLKNAYLAKKQEEAARGGVRRESHERLKAEVTQHAGKIQEHDAKIKDLAEQRRKDIQAELADHPQMLRTFNTLDSMISSQLLAHKIAKTKLFSAQTTNKYAKAAQTTQSLFNVAVDSVPVPFAKILPAITGTLVDMAVKSHTASITNAAIEATLGMDTDRLAIDVAALVTCKLMMVRSTSPDANIGTKMGALIVDRINGLKGKTFASQKELVDYLCEAAMQMIHKLGNHSDTSISDASSSTPPRVAMHVKAGHGDSPKKGKGNNKGCVIS